MKNNILKRLSKGTHKVNVEFKKFLIYLGSRDSTSINQFMSISNHSRLNQLMTRSVQCSVMMKISLLPKNGFFILNFAHQSISTNVSEQWTKYRFIKHFLVENFSLFHWRRLGYKYRFFMLLHIFLDVFTSPKTNKKKFGFSAIAKKTLRRFEELQTKRIE